MYQIELIGSWSTDVPSGLRERTEDIISWKIPHEAAWYPQPGRTLVLNSGRYSLKIKGAGFYNPGNVSFSGTRRTTEPVPEGDLPMPPIQKVFKRDIIHTDPTKVPPHVLESVHSTFAPIGGMTLDAAVNDQLMFSRLTAAGLPSNRPLVNYVYHDLRLEGKPMGVSVSLQPHDSLSMTLYDLYLLWNGVGVSTESFEFLKAYSGKENFSFENPAHRLECLAKFAYTAGKLLLQFSSKAALYRFSGGPDNWNLQRDLQEPLFFSDVDTSKPLAAILPTQVEAFVHPHHQAGFQ